MHHMSLTVSLSQELARRLMRNKGRAAASFFTNRGMHLGQALDSGGSDHIAGQRDTGSAYAWTRMRDPIPVTTANGVVYATWECTISTLLGPMRCYYLENGGPHQSLLSVDKLCREGEYTYIHTKWGAHIIYTSLTPKVTLSTSLQMEDYSTCLLSRMTRPSNAMISWQRRDKPSFRVIVPPSTVTHEIVSHDWDHVTTRVFGRC